MVNSGNEPNRTPWAPRFASARKPAMNQSERLTISLSSIGLTRSPDSAKVLFVTRPTNAGHPTACFRDRYIPTGCIKELLVECETRKFGRKVTDGQLMEHIFARDIEGKEVPVTRLTAKFRVTAQERVPTQHTESRLDCIQLFPALIEKQGFPTDPYVEQMQVATDTPTLSGRLLKCEGAESESGDVSVSSTAGVVCRTTFTASFAVRQYRILQGGVSRIKRV